MTLFDKTTQDRMLERIQKLNAASQRKWGKMSVSQMLKHMTIAFSVPINKIQVPKDKLYYLSANPLARWMMIKAVSKWPKNLITADSFIVKEDPDFETAKKDFLAAYSAFLKAEKYDGSHPVFGVMDKELWGNAMAIHLNHHLEQFGV